jgi:hypothetical protein
MYSAPTKAAPVAQPRPLLAPATKSMRVVDPDGPFAPAASSAPRQAAPPQQAAPQQQPAPQQRGGW